MHYENYSGHFGFEVVSDKPIPGTEVTHWGMMKQGGCVLTVHSRTLQRDTDEVLTGKSK